MITKEKINETNDLSTKRHLTCLDELQSLANQHLITITQLQEQILLEEQKLKMLLRNYGTDILTP